MRCTGCSRPVPENTPARLNAQGYFERLCDECRPAPVPARVIPTPVMAPTNTCPRCHDLQAYCLCLDPATNA